MGCWPALAHAAFSFLVFFDLSQPTDRKKFLDLPFPNTTKAQTQMEAPLVGVQGHQKQWENTKVLMEIDVFVCLVVQEAGVPRGFAPPDPSLRRIEPTAENCIQLRPAPPDVRWSHTPSAPR